MSELPAEPPRSDAASAADRASRRWRFHLLIEVANFAELRRLVGRERAKLIAADVVARGEQLLPELTAVAAGRGLVEIVFEAAARLSLDAALATLDAGFRLPVQFGADHHIIEVTLGAAGCIVGEADDVRLAEEAETALRQAREERSPVARDVAGTVVSIDRIALSRDLAAAISNGDLFLHYQPKVHLRRNQVTSVEALVRWRHPTRGLVMPGDFIPIAEETRDILELTLWTIRRVIADQATLADRGHDLTIFINIAGVLLCDPQFVRRACALVQGAGARIGFEITETSVIRDPESAIAHLNVFAEIGIVIAIDDYGAGLSSLAYLKQLPARELKIDKLFVTQLTSSHRDPLIVRSTIDLAHALEMEVVAEGVETPAALALLSVMGCDMAQGYLISRPIDLDALVRYLDEDSSKTAVPDTRASTAKLASAWQRR